MIELIAAIAVMYLTVTGAWLWLRSQRRRNEEGADS